MEHFNKWGQVVDCYFPGCVNFCSHSIITPASTSSSLRHVKCLTAATACLLRGAWSKVQDSSPRLKYAVLHAGKKGAKRVNYCFITFDNWRSAQRACNQSERNIFGKVS